MFLKISLLLIGLLFVPCQAAENNPIWNLTCDTSNNVTQAIGTNFSVTIISHCSSNVIDGCFITYVFNASDNSSDVAKVLVNEAGNNGNRAEVSLENGVTFHYEFRKLDTSNSVMFNLTVASSNQPHAVNLGILGFVGCETTFRFAEVDFSGCQNNSAFSVVVPDSDIAQYLDYGSIVCNNNGTTGRALFRNGSEALKSQCNANAHWKDEDDISCLYPIIAELQINGQQYNRTVELKYNHSNPNIEVSLACVSSGALDATNPTTFQVDNNKKINRFLSINPELNGKNISCYIENNYTAQFNDAHLSTSTLNIKFGPYKPPGYSSFCSSSNGSVLFYSNPRSLSNILSLVSLEKEIPANIKDCCDINYGVQGQMITPVDKLMNRSNLYLRTNYSGTYENYQVKLCENITIETTTTPVESTTFTAIIATGTTASLNILIPIAAAVGGLTLILAIISSCLCWRRIHKGKSENINKGKIENVNPLYGTAEDVCVDTSAKEEVANPLYGKVQSADNGVELHNVANKQKEDNVKKSQPGINSNDVYAVVQKGEKESEGKCDLVGPSQQNATYGVVNKKRKEGQDNSGCVALDQGDSMYAVVNKKEKRKEKSVSVGSDQKGDTYGVVDKKQKKSGNKKLNQTSESNIVIYAAVDRSKKNDKIGVSNSNPINASEVETYAAVDRSKKKNKK